MQLTDLLIYDNITIQCHDNPDADALASGFALHTYFEEQGKTVRFIYGGRNQIAKSSLLLMKEYLNIPVEYCNDKEASFPGLLLTVDCCHGEGNVTDFHAEQYAVIDHHQCETGIALAEVMPTLGSCSTLCWSMMRDAGFDFTGRTELATALYYGLMTDTGNFAELHHPLDRDMQDSLVINRPLVNQFYNSNISIRDMEIAGRAMLDYQFYEDYNIGVFHAEECDPNLLGLISDLTLQVDRFSTDLVYNEVPGGYKLSVRSCTKYVHANELATFLVGTIGSGGGHINKAGGFISASKFAAEYPGMTISEYLCERVKTYFTLTKIIDVKNYEPDTSGTKLYKKLPIPLGFVNPLDILPLGSRFMIRTLEGDLDMTVDGTFYIMIGLKGEVYPQKIEKFKSAYTVLDEPYQLETEYYPVLRSHSDGRIFKLERYARTCRSAGGAQILAKPLDCILKLFTEWDPDSYYLGKPGDYLACRESDPKDIYIIEKDIFAKTYTLVEEGEV